MTPRARRVIELLARRRDDSASPAECRELGELLAALTEREDAAVRTAQANHYCGVLGWPAAEVLPPRPAEGLG